MKKINKILISVSIGLAVGGAVGGAVAINNYNYNKTLQNRITDEEVEEELKKYFMSDYSIRLTGRIDYENITMVYFKRKSIHYIAQFNVVSNGLSFNWKLDRVVVDTIGY